MKTCLQIEDLIPLYNSGDLNNAGKLQVEKHLAECAACRQFNLEMQNLQKVLQAEAVSVDPNYGAELVVKIQNRLQKHKRQRKFMYYAVPALTALVVIVVLGFNLVGNNTLSRQWAKNSSAVDLYVDLTHSGFFSEEPENVFDQLSTSENQQISNEIQQSLRQEIITTNSPVPVDNYVIATAHLDDQDFELFLKKVEEFTL